MKLRYELGEELITEYTDLEYNSSENKFILKGNDSEPLEYHPILDLDPEYDPKDFSYELLENKDSTENSIFTVEIKNGKGWERIGWMFPVQALLSIEHTQAENEYFLKYAYIATYLLLNSKECSFKVDETDLLQEIGLEQLYEPRLNILVIDHNNCKAIGEFNLDNYIIGLYQYGYTWTGTIHGMLSLPESTDHRPGHLKLRRISNEIEHREIINMIFKEQLSNELHMLLRFYCLYQIVEILIQEIFEHKFRQLIEHIAADTENYFDVREDVSHIAAEKNRVNLLFNHYSKQIDVSSREALNNECKAFLSLFGRKTAEDVSGNLYAVRCLLVHKMYTINSAETPIKEMINNINASFLSVIQNLLISFHKE